jgi:hypothetical protein
MLASTEQAGPQFEELTIGAPPLAYTVSGSPFGSRADATERVPAAKRYVAPKHSVPTHFEQLQRHMLIDEVHVTEGVWFHASRVTGNGTEVKPSEADTVSE